MENFSYFDKTIIQYTFYTINTTNKYDLYLFN